MRRTAASADRTGAGIVGILETLAAELAACIDLTSVIDTLLEFGLRPMGARGVALGFVAEDELVVVAEAGAARGAYGPGRRLPIGASSPWTPVVRDCEAVWVADTPRALQDHDPGVELPKPEPAIAFLPLREAGATFGVLTVGYGAAQHFDDDHRAAMRTIANITALSLVGRILSGSPTSSGLASVTSFSSASPVTVCAWTHTIRVGDEWLTIEQYLAQVDGHTVTHGIRPDVIDDVAAGNAASVTVPIRRVP